MIGCWQPTHREKKMRPLVAGENAAVVGGASLTKRAVIDSEKRSRRLHLVRSGMVVVTCDLSCG